jgi:metallo-beta-lactamase class B
MRFGILLVVALASHLTAQEPVPACSNCATWNIPQKPFKIFGNSYYVGTHGLSSVLIASGAGHILIDGALPESAAQIVANIRSLGFRVEDIKLILSSHMHFDHAGSLAELQKLSGARVAASPWSAKAIQSGAVPRDDPQFGILRPIARIEKVEIVKDGETLRAGASSITAHFTPGHTPGGTSWTWRSCESSRCLNLVYADSLTPISADGYLFTRSHPQITEDFARSIAFLNNTACDILITPHPEAANLWQHLEQRSSSPDALIDTKACRVLAETSREKLKQRLAAEAGK